jgi:large subunit ribosomal protein L1
MVARADAAAACKAAGALEAGADELVDKIQKGWADFDVAVAHPSLMGKVGKLGRVLGPQGKMPSPKSGTVTPDIVTAVREYSAGKVEFRNDAGGNLHTIVGKLSFSDEDLKANTQAFLEHVRRIKPASAKGHYIKKVCISGTMTPSIELEVAAATE